jgi:hypothetical protein
MIVRRGLTIVGNHETRGCRSRRQEKDGGKQYEKRTRKQKRKKGNPNDYVAGHVISSLGPLVVRDSLQYLV